MKVPYGFNTADYTGGFSEVPTGTYKVIIKQGDTSFKTYDTGAVSCGIKVTITDGPFKNQSVISYLNNYYLPDNDPNKERQAWDWNTLASIVRAANNNADFVFDDTDKIENKPFMCEIKNQKSKDGTKTYYRIGKCEPIQNTFSAMSSMATSQQNSIPAFAQTQFAQQNPAPAQAQNQGAPWGNGNIPF